MTPDDPATADAASAGACAPRGRDRELEVIGEHLAAVARGQGGVLLIEGPPGIGKTTLLGAARALAGSVGVHTLSAAAFEDQQAAPFAPLRAMVEGIAPQAGSAEPAEHPYWMLHDLQGTLEQAARETPLALLFDDVQWADAGTLQALSILPERLPGVPILWILTLRTGRTRRQVRSALERLSRAGAARLRVGVLADDAVAAVIVDTLQGEPRPALLDMAASARGNPFLLAELLDGLREEGRVRVEGGQAAIDGGDLPRRVTGSMRDRLDRLSPAAAEVVRAASVLGYRFSAEQLAKLVGRRPSTIGAALDEALAADLFAEAGDELSFRHDLVRQAVRETLESAERRALQREAVEVLLQGGAAPVEVARQLAESAEAGDREAAAQLRAAARAVQASDPGAAADLALRSLEVLRPPDEELGALVAETILLLHQASRSDDARKLAERVLAGALPPDQEAQIRLSLSTSAGRSASTREKEAASRGALALSGLTPVMRARHLGWLAYNLGRTGQVDEATAISASAIAAAEATGDVEAQAITTVALLRVDRSRGSCLLVLERVEELQQRIDAAEPRPVLHPVDFLHFAALVDLGRLDEALGFLAGVVARAREDRNAWLLERWTQVGSRALLAAGRLADARAEAESCDTLVADAAAGSNSAAVAMLVVAQTAIHTGDTRQIADSVSAAVSVLDGSGGVVRRHATLILALAAMSRDDPAGAVLRLRDDEQPYAVPFQPVDAGHQPTVARIAQAAGQRQLALRAIEVADSFERENPGVAVFAATAAQTRGLAGGDSDPLLEAARILRGTQRRLLAAEAAEDAGHQLAREGRRDDAVELLSEAFDAFAALAATADARRAGSALRTLGVRRRLAAHARPASGWGSLTESELRVARLVGAGATNRDAAERLVLSPHTVSSHLRSAFAKLAVASRGELARIVLANDRECCAPS